VTNEEKVLEEVFGKLREDRPKCNFLKCYAGTGVAGNGICFLKGNPNNPNCPKFIDEDEELKRQEAEYRGIK